jgi:hypothetical protein
MVLVAQPAGIMVTLMKWVKGVVDRITTRLQSIFKHIKDVFDRLKAFMFAMRWVPVIGLVVTAIAIFNKPLGFIMMLFVALLITILWVLYWFTSLPGIIWSPFIIWWLATKFIPLLIYTIVIFAIILVICILLLIITLINMMTGGKLNNIVLCQNSPQNWFLVPSYQYGNKYERSLFCKSPCMGGYKPDETGDICDKLPRGQPSFCPQSEIMRIFTRKNGTLERHVYEDFNPVKFPMFNFGSPESKELTYKEYYMRRDRFFKTCNDTLGGFDDVARTLCANIDVLAKNGYSKTQITKMKEVCAQGFCDSKSRFMFCNNFGKTNDEKSKGSELIKYIVLLIIVVILFVFLMMFTYYLLLSIQENKE